MRIIIILFNVFFAMRTFEQHVGVGETLATATRLQVKAADEGDVVTVKFYQSIADPNRSAFYGHKLY